MASSWFKGLSSILSRRNNKKKVAPRQTSKLHRDLYLEPLETRLNPSNYSYEGTVLTIWLTGSDSVNTTFTINNGASNGTASPTITITTTSAVGWVNGNPNTGLNTFTSGATPSAYNGTTATLTINTTNTLNPINNISGVAFTSTTFADSAVIFGSSTIGGIFLTNINNGTTRVAGDGYIVAPTTANTGITIAGGSPTVAAIATGFVGFKRGDIYNLSTSTGNTAFVANDGITIGGSATAVMLDADTFQILTPGAYTTLQPGGGFLVAGASGGGQTRSGTFNPVAGNAAVVGTSFATTGAYGGLVRVTVNNGGSGYSNPITVTIPAPTTVGATNVAATAIANTTGLDLQNLGSGAANISVQVLPTAIWDISISGYLASKGTGDISLNAGSAAGTSFTVSPYALNTLNSFSIYAPSGGNITIQANSGDSDVIIGAGNQIVAGGATGSISIQGGTNPASQHGTILNSGVVIQTTGGNISFPGGNSAVLLQNNVSFPSPVLLKSGTGNISISGSLDNYASGDPVAINFATSGNVSVVNRIGIVHGAIGAILLQGGTNGGITDLTFGTNATLTTEIVAERLSLVSTGDALRGNVNVFATQNYVNGTAGTKGIYLELLNATAINFWDTVQVSSTTGNLTDADVYLDGNSSSVGGTGGSLKFVKGLTTAGKLVILDMANNITVGNANVASTVQAGTGGISVTNPVVLEGNTTFRALTDGLNSKDISFGSSITNLGTSRNLNINTAGAVTFNSLGTGLALGNVVLDIASTGLSILGAASIVNVGGLSTTVALAGPIDLSAPTATQNYRGNVVLRTSSGSIKTNIMNMNSIGNVTLGTTDATASGTIEVLGSVSNIANFFSQEAATKVLVGNANPVLLSNVNGSSTGFAFASPVFLNQNLSITGASGTNISFNNTIDSTSAVRTLTLNTSNGQISFFNDIGATGGAGRISLDATASGSGKVVFNASADNINTQTGFKVSGNVIINASTTFNESSGNIQFVNDLSGNGNLTNNATFSTPGQLLFGSLGQSATGPAGALKDILITGTNPSLFTSGAITAQSLKTDGSVTVAGAFTVSGAQTYTDAVAPTGDNDVVVSASGTITMGVINTVDGLSLSTISSGSANIILSNTNATGDALLNHGGNLQFTGTSFKANSFTETSGTGSVLLGAGLGSAVTIEVTGITEDILFSRPVLLNDGATLKGSGAGSSLTFGSSVRSVGAKALNINNIQGNIIFQGNVGDNSPTQPLGDISITNGSPTLLQAMGTIFNAASVSVSSTTPVIGNIDFSTVTTTLTGTNGLTLSTNHDNHIITLQKDVPGTMFTIGQVLNVGQTAQTGTAFTTIATIEVLSIDGAGGIASFEIRTAGTGYTAGGQFFLSTTGAPTVPLAAQVTVTQVNSSSNIALGPVNLSSAGGLTLNSSPSDTVSLTGNITNAAGISQNGAVKVTLGTTSAITLTTAGSSGAVFGGDLIVAQNTQMNVGGGITITGTINSVDSNNIRTLGLQSTLGTINTNSDIGVSVPLFTFTANAGLNGTVTIQDIGLGNNSVSVVTQAGITITGNLNLVEADTTLDGGTGGNVAINGNISGPVASTDLTLKTNGGAISVTGATGIGTNAVRMGEIVIDGTPASLQITGSIYADSISTINNLAGPITVGGSQFITNNVKLYSNSGPINLGSITTDNGGLLTAVTITGASTGFNTGEAVTISGGTTNATGTATVTGGILTISILTQGSGFVNGQTVTITGPSANTIGTATVASNIDIQANSGAVTVGAMNAGTNAAGAINIKHGSTLTLNNNITAGSFTETVGSNGNIVVGNTTPVTFQVSGTNTGFQFLNPVQLKQNLTILSNNNVIFDGTVDTQTGSTSKNLAITVQSGTSKNVTFSGAVGSNVNVVMGDITIGGATNINAGTNTITALSLDATATGVITLKGLQTYSGSSGLKLTADGDIFVGNINTSNSGNVSFINDDDLNILGNITSAGNITQTTKSGGPGVSLVTFGDTNSAATLVMQSTTTGLPVSFDASMVLNRDVQFKSVGTGSITVGTTTSGTNTTINGFYSLVLQSTGGAVINLNSDLGTTNGNEPSSLTVTTVPASGGRINVASRTIKTAGLNGQVFTGNVDYANNLILSSASGPITFNNQLDSTNTATLALTSTGALSFQAIGSTNKVGAISITTSSNGFSATSVNAISLTNTGSALVGNINITAIQTYSADIDLDTTASISMANSITSSAGKIDLTSGGFLSVAGLSALNVTNGAIALTHNGILSLNGNIQSGTTFTESTTSNTTISVGSGAGGVLSVIVGSGNFAIDSDISLMTLNNDFSITTQAPSGNVLLRSAINSPTGKALTISSTGNVVFSNPVGQVGRLGAISLTANSTSLTATGVNITAASITTGSATTVAGPISLTGALDLNAVGGLVLKTSAAGTIALGTVTTTNGGPVTIQNDGNLTLNGNITANGSIQQTSLNVITTPTVFFGLSSGSGTLAITSNAATGLISFASPIILEQSASLSAVGNGSISLGQVDNDPTLPSKNLSASVTGTNGTINLNKSIGFGVNGALAQITMNAGTLGVINSSANNFKTTGNGGQSYTGRINLQQAGASPANRLTITAGAGNVLVTGDMVGSTSEGQDFTVDTTGSFQLTGNMGAGTSLGAVTLNNLLSLTLGTTAANTIAAKSLSATGITGNIIINSSQAYSGDVNIQGALDITTGSILSTAGNISANATGNLTVGNLSTTGTSPNGAISLTHNGRLTLSGDVTSSNTFDVTSGSASSITIGGTSATSIQIASGDFNLTRNVTLNQDLTIRTLGGLTADVLFGGLLDGVTGKTPNLTISSQGIFGVTGAIGSSQRLGDIKVNNGTGNQLSALNLLGTITAGSLNSGIVAGNIALTQDQNYNFVGGLNLTTTTSNSQVGNITLGSIITSNGAALTLKNSGALVFAKGITIDGAISQISGVTTGTVPANPSVTIGTAGGLPVIMKSNTAGISIGSKLDLVQNTTFQTGGNGAAVFSNTVDSTATKDLVITTSGTGTTQFNSNVGINNALGSLSITSQTTFINGATGGVKTTNSAGQVYNGTVNLGAGTQSLVANGGGPLSFNGIVNGPGNLKLTTTGVINFTNNIGSGAVVGDIEILNANPTSLTVTGTVNAASLITTTAVNGLISITSAQSYNGLGGLVLATSGLFPITVGSITTTNAGSTVSFTHSGDLNLQGNISDLGTFVQNGTGGGIVVVGKAGGLNLQVGTGSVAFNKNVSMTSDLLIQTAAAAGNISFGSNLNSSGVTPYNLTIGSTGVLTFSGSVGNLFALGDILTSNGILRGISANGISTDSTAVIKAASFTTGNVNGGISLLTPQTYTPRVVSGNALSLTTIGSSNDIILGPVTTLNGGKVLILNSDLVSFQGAFSFDGTITQTNNSVNAKVEFGSATSAFSMNTTGDTISFLAPITLVQSAILSTGATGLGDITLSANIDSFANASNTLTLQNANGNANLNGSIGTATNGRLGSLLVNSTSINFGGTNQVINTSLAAGQDYRGLVVLNSNVTMDASSAGNISYSSTINSGISAKSLTISNAQNVLFSASIGKAVALTSLGVTSSATTLTGADVVTSGSGQTYNTVLSLGTLAPATVNLTAGSGTVSFGGSVNMGTKNMTVSGDEIDIASTISATGSNLVLQPGTLFNPVVVGDTATSAGLDITVTELANLSDGFGSITIGRGTSNANLTVAGVLINSQIRDPFTLTTGGSLIVSNPIAAVDNATLSLINPNTSTGNIVLNSSISSAGQIITVDGVVQVGGSGGSIATTNGVSTGANIILNSALGSLSGAGTLSLDSGTTGLIQATTGISMTGGITITNSGGANFTKAVSTGALSILATTSGKDVAFNGTLNAASLNTSTGAFNLKILSGGNITGATTLNNTGTTTLGDQTTDALTFAGGLTANSSSLLNLAGTIATTNNAMTLGNSVLTTNTILQSGSGTITTGSVTGGAGIKLSLQNNIATGTVNLTGNVTVNQLETFAGAYAVSLTGSSNQISSGTATTFSNTGGVTFGDSTTDVSTFTNGLIATASTVNLAGTVATTNSAMNLGAVTLTTDGTVKSGSGTITIASVIGATRKLSLQDNTSNSRGLVVVNGTVTVGQIETFAQNYAVSLLGNSTVTSASTFNNTGATTFGDGGTGVDTVTFTGGLTAKAGAVNLNSNLVTTNNLLDIGVVTLAGNSTLQSGTGTITVGSITDGANSYTLNLQDNSGAASQGSVIFSGDVTISAISTAAKTYAITFQNNTTVDTATTFTNTAGVSFGKNASSLTTFTNGVTAIAGSGTVGLAGSFKATGQAINLGSSTLSINLISDVAIDSGNSSSAVITLNAVNTNGKALSLNSGSTTGANITVASVDSTAGGLTIVNAGGLVRFTGNVGAVTNSGLVNITNSQQGVEFLGQLYGSNVNIANTAVNSTIKFGGNLTLTGQIVTSLNNYNVDILGTTNSIGAATSFNNLGNVNLNSTSGTTTFANGFGAAFPAAVNLNGTIIANGQVNISKPVNILGPTTATLNSGTNTISGTVAGSNTLTMNGAGSLVLTGNSPYSGTINANAGNVAVNANFAAANVIVGAAGKISGTGTISTLTANGGIVAPGNSPGTLTVGTATLGATGAQTAYNVEINGASAGQFDQIKVNTSASLANAVLNITAAGNLLVGQQFQIVSGTTTGQFSNAVSTILAGNTTFSVTYNGNGVLLTVTSVTPSPTPTPSPSPSPSPSPTPSPTPAPTPTPPAPSPTPTPTPTGPYVLFATGADAGGGPEVKVNFTDGSSVSFYAYDMAYRGGVRVTMGDLNGDGTNEIITGTGPGGGPNIRVFNVTSSGSVTMVANFFAFEPQFMGGVYVAAGNLNGDVSASGKGIADLIVSAGPGGGPRVIAYSGGANYVNLNNQLCDYFVYSPAFTGGVSVAAGNVFGAVGSADELITGAGPGGGPHVRAFQLSNTNTPNSVLEYMAFDPAIRNGIYVGAGDLDNDGYDEIFTGTNSSPSLPTMVNVRYGNGNQAVVYPFGEFTGGARVGVAKDNNNNQYMVVGAGPGGGPLVQIYNRNLIAIDSLFAFPLNFTGGVFVSTSIS